MKIVKNFRYKLKIFQNKTIQSTNPSIPGVTTTPPLPNYHNNKINNNQMKILKILS